MPVPEYDRDRVTVGVVHFGVGGFHRAHQAMYLDRLMGAGEALAGPTASAQERTIDVQINRLRRKLERDPANPLYLQTARGAGYKLVADP